MKMKAKYIITPENKQEIEAARKKNKDKNVEKRLLALSLRSDGKTLREIAEITGYNCRYVGDLVEKYCKNGLAAITENHYKGNRRNMSYQEEQDFLMRIRNRARKDSLWIQQTFAKHTRNVLDIVLAVDRFIAFFVDMAGEKSFPEASTQRKPAKRS